MFAFKTQEQSDAHIPLASIISINSTGSSVVMSRNCLVWSESMSISVTTTATYNLVGVKISTRTVRSNTWAASHYQNIITDEIKFQFQPSEDIHRPPVRGEIPNQSIQIDSTSRQQPHQRHNSTLNVSSDLYFQSSRTYPTSSIH